jgi:hypothetical protein
METQTSTLALAILVLALSCNDNGKPIFSKTTLSDSLNVQTKDSLTRKHNVSQFPVSFNDFEVSEVDNKRYANLDLKSNKYANSFRTRLRDGYAADTTNFAGHYTFVIWGCGTECQMSMIIDRRTGKIYDSPEASCGYDFTADSRMLIVNPPDTSGSYSDDNFINCKPTIFIFDEQTKTFDERRSEVK